MRLKNHFLLITAATFAFSLTLMAQDKDVSIDVELTTLAWERPVSKIYYLSEGKTEELKAYTGGFSMPFKYTGSSTIQFYANEADLALEPQDRPSPVATAQVDPTLQQCLLIFFPLLNGGYRVMSQDFSADRFPAKTCRIHNLSDNPIVFAFGDKPTIHKIDPYQTSVVDQSGLEDKTQMVKIQIAHNEQGELRLMYRSLWSVKDGTRSTVLVIPDKTGNGAVQLKKFVERGVH